jgi:hypothetical protein
VRKMARCRLCAQVGYHAGPTAGCVKGFGAKLAPHTEVAAEYARLAREGRDESTW